MPSVFHDPIYGETLGHFTHYAAIVGEGPGPKRAGAMPATPRFETVFSPAGLPMKGATIWPLQRLTYADVSLGTNRELSVQSPLILTDRIQRSGITTTGSLIIVAAVSPERKIPWTKPEDIAVGPEFPLEIGKPGGIAAPYSFGKGPTSHRAAPVLLADGSSGGLVDTIDPATRYAVLTPAGGQVVGAWGGGVTRAGGYLWSHSPQLVIDCESGSATIIEPNQAIRPDLELRMPDDPPPGKP